MPYALCPIPNSRCPMPDAQCPMPDAQFPIPIIELILTFAIVNEWRLIVSEISWLIRQFVDR